ncbi:MAG: Nitrilase/cyanide hydratase and apolipoprotein N-acyltransferase [Candidatus Magnetoglobus multicellularis str. Araruama]|uniref:Nitrilase/cyanide hydratase and apolipoprotein N-acyltransferase n=1 Tax=Candidatus Magnetoglobus multicellularis str. Araruama TaxID=890399 RepID=A0A1V1PCW7_9BACT|nr:MAG: Nitrilase/cyanide hydratase and apolipoprotein N-acyltransferase [Candidatus Magnetoglobus multicellularis str. Araruama]
MELTLSLIHLNVRYKEIESNRKELIELNRKAAKKSQFIVNTEMAISGYSFTSLIDIDAYVETENGPTLLALKEIAKTNNVYICIGFAEKDIKTGILYNAAHIIDPSGKIICKYRKINAEARWACPGEGNQDNTFETPWGKMGVLICSDTYYGLFARQTALRGAQMILIPSNWPSSGIDPRNIWRARAMENGIYMVACNRSGKDRLMSCDNAWSCAYTPGGDEILSQRSMDSTILSFQIPLLNGKLTNTYRKNVLKTRKSELYHSIYLDMRHSDYDGGDFTSYYNMPKPGKYSIISFAKEILSKSLSSKKDNGLYDCFLKKLIRKF